MAYNDGMVDMIVVAEMERVIVLRSRDARGSSESESVRGWVEVRGEAAREDSSMEADDDGVVGVVIDIVGGFLVLSPSLEEEEEEGETVT